MSIKPGALRFNTDSMKLEIFRGADTGVYNDPVEDVVAYSGTSLFWDDSPIGAFTLSNNNRTATTNDGNGGSYTNGDVYSTAIAAGNTYAWTLRVVNGDTTGGWYFTDSQTASGTHADQRNESSGNASGLRGGETGASTYGDYATANGTSSAQNQIALNSDVSPNGTKNIEFVVYRPSSGTGKVWIRAEGAGSWIGGGDPSNTSSTATIVLPDATTYFGFVQYDRSTTATFTLDIESSGGYYGPRLAGQWEEIQATSPEIQTGGTRGIFYSGNVPTNDVIQYVNIDTTGDAVDFGDANLDTRVAASFSSRTRCFKAGGYNDPSGGKDNIEFVTFASTGNGTDFGDLTNSKWNACGFSNSTRGIAAGGEFPGTPFFDVIEFVTMSSAGNAVDFGNMIAGNQVGQNAGMSSQTRGILAGGYISPGVNTDVIQYVTISTQGNAADFGDLQSAENRTGCCSNAVRGLMGAGDPNTNRISFLTMASLGNAVDFGDSTNNSEGKAGMNSPTRGIWGGSDSDAIDTIEYVQIMSTGDAVDFGNLLSGRRQSSGSSNGHGGL